MSHEEPKTTYDEACNILIMNNETMSNFNWDSGWVQPYESLPSIFSKFAIANVVDTKTVIKLFTLKKSFSYQLKRSITSKAAIHTINSTRFENIIGLPVENLLSRDPIQIVPGSAHNLLMKSKQLRYCPDCLARGYHCTHMQLLPLRACPLHNTKLIDICHHCGRQIPINFTFPADNIYACPSCGHAFWPQSDPVVWPKCNLSDDEVRILSDIDGWFINLKNRVLDMYQPIDIENGISDERLEVQPNNQQEVTTYDRLSIFFTDIVGFALSNAVPIDESAKFTHTLSRRGYTQGEIYKIKSTNKNVDHFDCDTLLDSLVSIYKSIKRHISKVFLARTHSFCAREFTKAVRWVPDVDKFFSYCHHAIVFLSWRKHWENTLMPGKLRKSIRVFVDNAYNRSNEFPEDDFERRMMMKLFALECQWTFLEALSNAVYLERNGNLRWGAKLIYGKMLPFWAVEKRGSGDKVLHTWKLNLQSSFLGEGFRKIESRKRHKLRSAMISASIRQYWVESIKSAKHLALPTSLS